MSQSEYDKILNAIAYDADLTAAMKKLWKKYQQLIGATIYNQPPTFNIYYDKPSQQSEATS